MEIEKMKFFVNNSIKVLKSKNLLWTFDSDVPIEMKNTEVPEKNGWYSWKFIKSIISDEEINNLEQEIPLKYPKLYIEFLKYKHFYRLEKIENIELFTHKSDSWYSDLINQYNMQEPEVILKNGLIPFGFYEGGKIACFDTNNKHRIISVFYDSNLNTDPLIEPLFDSFDSMLNSYFEKRNSA